MKYKLPPLKRADTGTDPVPVSISEDEESYPADWDRRIRIPISAEMAKQFRVGDEGRVTLTGHVDGVQSQENGKNELTLYLAEVDHGGDSDLEDFEEGFSRGAGTGRSYAG